MEDKEFVALRSPIMGDIICTKELGWYDGPLCFVGRDKYNTLLFVHNIERDKKYYHYLIVLPTAERLALFLDNKITYRDMLFNSGDIYYHIDPMKEGLGSITSKVSKEGISQDFLPDEGLYFNEDGSI